MGLKLYVGNLPFNTGDDELKLAFAQCGGVREAKVITDRETGRSRGFGFVTMMSAGEADAAIARWNGSAFGGRDLIVNEAKEKERSGGGAGTGSYNSAGGYSSGSPSRGGPPPDAGRKGDGRRRGRRDRQDDYS